MSDLINRQDAMNAIQKRADEVDSVYSAFWEGLKIAQDIVEKVPSAEPERKSGEWLDCRVLDNANYEIPQWQTAQCSVCGKYHTTPHMYNFSSFAYCPNCGADMRGEVNDEIDRC